MAVMTGARVRGNNAQGTTTDNPLTNVATTMNSAGLANLPAVSSAHAVIILDPLRVAGAPEIVVVTAHTASATSATITRGAYGTSARQHVSGTTWVHAATIDDVIRICTSSTRPSDIYEGQLIYETDTDAFKAHNGSAWEQVLTLGAWTSWTPTITQSAAVTITINRARYTKIGRTVHLQAKITMASTGTASNAIAIGGIPIAPAASAADQLMSGMGYLYDTSATASFSGPIYMGAAATFNVVDEDATTANNLLGVSGFTAALASGDLLWIDCTYEAVS